MIALRPVLERISLPEDWTAISDERPSYSLNWRGVEITIARMMSLEMREIWNFGGFYRTRNSMGIVDFAMPLEVESHEQAIAWMAEHLVRKSRIPGAPEWLTAGLQWRSELPWVRRLAAYAAREHCTVERDWFRLPVKTMQAWAETCIPSDTAEFAFDGHVLRIAAVREVLALPATGIVWATPINVAVASLKHLPKRLMRSAIEIAIWEGSLRIDRLDLPLVGSLAVARELGPHDNQQGSSFG